jgi:hypothetical protein
LENPEIVDLYPQFNEIILHVFVNYDGNFGDLTVTLSDLAQGTYSVDAGGEITLTLPRPSITGSIRVTVTGPGGISDVVDVPFDP